MNNLRIKIFININILELKAIVFDVTQKKIVINSCDMIAFLFVIQKEKCVERKLRSRKQITISLHIVIIISIKYCDKIILNNCNYNFLFRFNIALEFNDNFFAHIVNANVKTI